jgi:Dual specificity phosphatase, catalytic domain
VIGDNLILGAHPADTMPPNVDVIANVDSFRFYDVPEGVVYLHFTYREMDAVPDATELDVVATFLNDLRTTGKTVFVHCRLGLNRSALLPGLMLIDEGYLAEDAIDLMRPPQPVGCQNSLHTQDHAELQAQPSFDTPDAIERRLEDLERETQASWPPRPAAGHDLQGFTSTHIATGPRAKHRIGFAPPEDEACAGFPRNSEGVALASEMLVASREQVFHRRGGGSRVLTSLSPAAK